eukprot:1806879-Prymnesium_polylepis.1
MAERSMTIKEVKAAMDDMKRMRNDNKKMLEWESEMDDNRNKRTHLADSLRLVYDEIDRHRNAIWYQEVSEKLGLEKDKLQDVRLPISDGMVELLGTARWKKKLQARSRPPNARAARQTRAVVLGVARSAHAPPAPPRIAVPSVAPRPAPHTRSCCWPACFALCAVAARSERRERNSERRRRPAHPT